MNSIKENMIANDIRKAILKIPENEKLTIHCENPEWLMNFLKRNDISLERIEIAKLKEPKELEGLKTHSVNIRYDNW